MTTTLSADQYKTISSTIRKSRFGVDSLSAFDLASAFGIAYTGDCNLEHGGIFYDPSTWEDGYVDAVSVDMVDGHVSVDCGQIINSQVDSALRCCRYRRDADGIVTESGDIVADTPESIRACEIESCWLYMGIEPETSRMFPITDDGNRPEYFTADGANVPIGNLQGWAWRRYVVGNVIYLD